MPDLPYMAEPGFALLVAACKDAPRAQVAKRLGVSAPVVGQVLNGSGAYGSGKASPRKLFARVEAAYGHWPCPHLTEQSEDGQPQVISASRCRDLAHRAAPTGSPRDIAHWQACRRCPHAAATTPPVPRPKVPRKRQPAATDPAAVPAITTQPAQEGNAP